MHAERKRTVLIVDDDETNLMILNKGVRDAGYIPQPFSSGEKGWEYMQDHTGEIDIVLLDKMMPGLNGTDILRRMKRDQLLRNIPVIMQTGDVGLEQMRKDMDAGAYYYLTKPFNPAELTAILHSAANECCMRDELTGMANSNILFIKLLSQGTFYLKTHDEARLLAMMLAQSSIYSEFLVMGLMELLSNAIEHGNLGIGYKRKRECIINGTWDQELKERHNNYQDRLVKVHCERVGNDVSITISDQGTGFNWRDWMHEGEGSQRITDPNGHGISKALIMLDDLRYVGEGNEVHCTLRPETPQALCSRTTMPLSESDCGPL